jgi:hypothetical protein
MRFAHGKCVTRSTLHRRLLHHRRAHRQRLRNRANLKSLSEPDHFRHQHRLLQGDSRPSLRRLLTD